MCGQPFGSSGEGYIETASMSHSYKVDTGDSDFYSVERGIFSFINVYHSHYLLFI
jgi:hypothetical protein